MCFFVIVCVGETGLWFGREREERLGEGMGEGMGVRQRDLLIGKSDEGFPSLLLEMSSAFLNHC